MFNWVQQPNSVEHNPMDGVRLGSISSSSFVQKSNSHKVRCSISFDWRIQWNPIHGLSSISERWIEFVGSLLVQFSPFVVSQWKKIRTVYSSRVVSFNLQPSTIALRSDRCYTVREAEYLKCKHSTNPNTQDAILNWSGNIYESGYFSYSVNLAL